MATECLVLVLIVDALRTRWPNWRPTKWELDALGASVGHLLRGPSVTLTVSECPLGGGNWVPWLDACGHFSVLVVPHAIEGFMGTQAKPWVPHAILHIT